MTFHTKTQRDGRNVMITLSCLMDEKEDCGEE